MASMRAEVLCCAVGLGEAVNLMRLTALRKRSVLNESVSWRRTAPAACSAVGCALGELVRTRPDALPVLGREKTRTTEASEAHR